MGPLFEKSQAEDALEPDVLLDAAADIPCVALETEGSRLGASPNQLSTHPFFWTVDSAFFASAESLVREIPTSVAISRLVEVMGQESLQLPEGPFVSLPGRRGIVDKLVFRNREVDRIVVNAQQRRVDLRWANIGKVPIWRDAWPETRDLRNMIMAMVGSRRTQASAEGIHLASGAPELVGANGEAVVRSLGHVFVLPGPLSSFLLRRREEIESSSSGQRRLAAYAIALGALFIRFAITNVSEFVRQEAGRISRETPFGHYPVQEDSELIKTLTSAKLPPFDPRAWSREGEYQ